MSCSCKCAAVGLLAFSLAAPAYASADTLYLAGRAPPLAAVGVQPMPQVSDHLDLRARTTPYEVTVATITEECNNAAGYRIVASSVGQGRLLAEGPGSVAYQVAYGDSGWLDLTEPTTVAEVAGITAGATLRSIDVRYAVPQGLPVAHYSDVITFDLIVP